MNNLDSPQNDFYQWTNKEWLNDPKNEIPPEYSTWGGFLKLYDDGLKNQIDLVKNLDSENKLACVWKESMKMFDYKTNTFDPILNELKMLKDNLPTFSIQNLSNYVAICKMNGFGGFFDIDKGPDLKNSDNIKLDIAPSGLSLPSRAFYFDEKFAKQRDLFKNHLENVYQIASSNGIELDKHFVKNVIDFEMMLGQITMKKDQARDYDKYYTNTNLTDFYNKIDQLNSHPDKQNNYLDRYNPQYVLVVPHYLPDKIRTFETNALVEEFVKLDERIFGGLWVNPSI